MKMLVFLHCLRHIFDSCTCTNLQTTPCSIIYLGLGGMRGGLPLDYYKMLLFSGQLAGSGNNITYEKFIGGSYINIVDFSAGQNSTNVF